MESFNETATRIIGKPMNGFVKDLLAEAALTNEQRVLIALSRIADGMDGINTDGCSQGKLDRKRIEELEKKSVRIIGFFAGFAALMGVLVFLKTLLGS